MSIRLQLVGIDLKKLKSVFGCKDPKVAEDLKRRCKKFFDEFFDGIILESEQNDLLKIQSLIEDIVMGKITPQEAEEHNFFPLLLKNVLIFYGQDVIWAGSNDWLDFRNYLSDIAKWKLRKYEKSEELGLLDTQRALFTEYLKLPPMEFSYTYLKNNEVKNLLDYVEKHKEVFYDEKLLSEHSVWGREFPRFLKEVREKGADLFYSAF